MIARGVAREREIGIRIAVGASRKRIFRQLFTESLLLALLGSAAGLALGCAVIQITLVKVDAPGWLNSVPDWKVLLFGLAIAFAAAVFFGFTPALQLAKQRHRKTLARQILIGGQIAASCMLLIVSLLLVRAVDHVLYTDPGFGYEQVLGIDPSLGSHGYSPAAARAYLTQLTNRLRTLPGVTAVSLSKIPLLGHGLTSYMTVDLGGHSVNIYPDWVTPDFFQTMGIRLLRGRTLLPGEKNAVIVSESLARKQYPDQDPLGKRLWRDGTNQDRIVGIVRNARIKAMNDGDAVEAYWAAQPDDMPSMTILVKTAGAPAGLAPRIKSIAERLDPKIFASVWLLKSGFHETARDLENVAAAVSLLGFVAVLISGIGILGLMAYTISQQSKEIAIRLALGARHVQVMVAILRQFEWPVLLGLVTGAGVTAAVSNVLRKGLYGVSNLDPVSYATAILILIMVIALAALLPARRVLRLNLVKTLHYQ